MLHATGVTKRIGGRVVLDRVDLDVVPGEAVALMGPNGAGKSTLLRALAWLSPPSSGQVTVGETRLPAASPGARSQMGVLLHHTFLYESLTGLENLVLHARLHGVADPKRAAGQWLERVGLTLFAHEPSRTYSRGMQQRLAIARTLIHRPKVLLLDEPYTGLDLDGEELLSGLIRQFRDGGGSVLMVTHDLETGAAVSDRFIVLVRGRVSGEMAAGAVSRAGLEELYRQGRAKP